MIIVTFGSSLTLRDITLDGGDAQAPMIAVEGSYGFPPRLPLPPARCCATARSPPPPCPAAECSPRARCPRFHAGGRGCAELFLERSGRGGLAFIGGAAFSMSGGTIQGCTAAYYGGGVYLQDSSMEMTGGAVTGNKSGSGAASPCGPKRPQRRGPLPADQPRHAHFGRRRPCDG